MPSIRSILDHSSMYSVTTLQEQINKWQYAIMDSGVPIAKYH